jgi:hypothetical protein
MLFYSPGVSIGDGCVIGAGSVVSRSIPAYHIAAGVPTRVIRKVASDVPDCQSHQKTESLDRGKFLDGVQPKEWLEVVKAKLPVWDGKPRHIAVDACVVVVAASFGYWLRG